MIYQVQDPQGNIHEIEGPENATQDEIMEQAQKLIPEQPVQKETGPGKIAQTVSSIARPVLQIGGAVGGAALAGGASAPTVAGVIPGAMAGGALGFAGGESAANALDRALGIKAPISSIPEAMKETAGNIQSGAASEAAGPAAGFALRTGAKVVKGVGKGLISATLGPTMKAVKARFARNAEIQMAKPFDELAQALPHDIQQLGDEVSNMSGRALDTLSTSKYLMNGAKAKDTILKAIKTERNKLGRSVSDASVQAKKALDRYAYRLRRLNNTVSESELGQIVRDIDNDINWSFKEMAPKNHALQGVRVNIDTILKNENPAYKELMQPVAEGTDLLMKAKNAFYLEHDIGKGFKAGNNTATALKSATDPRRIAARDILRRLSDITGKDYLKAAEDSAIAEQFVGGRTNGSKNVNLGTIVGTGTGLGIGSLLGFGGGPVGMVAGGLTGSYIDKEGGRMAGTLIDKLVQQSAAMGRVPALSPAMQRALAAAGVSAAGQ